MKIPVPGETGLIVFPPAEIRTEINRWRRIYNAYNKSVAPHITIAYPFIPENEWTESRDLLIKALVNIRPFRIRLKELGYFIKNEFVLWLKPDDRGNLTRINTILNKEFPKYVSSSLGYIPHLTLGFFNSLKELHNARKDLIKKLMPLEFQVDYIIYAIFDEDAWRIHDRISLG